MERAEQAGLAVAVVGHAALLAALTLGIASWEPAPPSAPIEVSFVEEVGPVSAAPELSTEAPAPRPSSDSSSSQQQVPAPAATAPDLRPSPPQPQTRQPRPPRSSPAPTRAGTNLPDPGSFDTTKEGRSPRPPAASVSPQAMASIIAAIQRQIQPCADRQPYPGRGAERIRVTLNLRLRPDGSFASRPTLVSGRTSGVDDENRRYVERVGDLILAAASACAPFRGLPDEYYRTPGGGWNNINVNYSLPG